jgi:hypothetical protein
MLLARGIDCTCSYGNLDPTGKLLRQCRSLLAERNPHQERRALVEKEGLREKEQERRLRERRLRERETVERWWREAVERERWKH